MVGIFFITFSIFVVVIPNRFVQAWIFVPTSLTPRQSRISLSTIPLIPADALFSSGTPGGVPEYDGDDAMKRTTFDEAGKSLIDEEDSKRMDAMGDYDLNPDVSRLDKIFNL
jgi:hypothetical protein